MSDRPSFRTGQGDLEDKIVATVPRLSKKQKEIARFILDNQDFVAFASANDIATRTQTSAATVVRFCQALGYEGYVHLQEAVRGWIPIHQTPVQRIQERLVSPIPREDLLAHAFAADIHNIERTADLTVSHLLQAAVDKMGCARRILVVGDGLAAAPAVFFAHALQVIGLPGQSITCGGEPLALALAFLQPEDVVVGIGLWRNLRDVVGAIQQAREIGATTIGVTDSRLSPLARQSDYPFLVATDGVAHSLSLVAVVSLLNVMLAALSYSMPQQVIEALHLVDEAYKRSALLAE
jgi:DNA-binding MurR/RpiR family transcriptional regulator